MLCYAVHCFVCFIFFHFFSYFISLHLWCKQSEFLRRLFGICCGCTLAIYAQHCILFSIWSFHFPWSLFASYIMLHFGLTHDLTSKYGRHDHFHCNIPLHKWNSIFYHFSVVAFHLALFWRAKWILYCFGNVSLNSTH